MNNALNSFAPSNDVDINLGGECVSSKFQRPDGVLLPGQEGSNSISSINQPHQVDHTSVQVHKSSFGGREPSYLHDGSRIAMGSEAYAGEAQRLASTAFASSDFKQEKPVVVSCEEPTHSNDGSETLANGLKQVSSSKFNLPGRKEYIQQELDYFDHVIQRFNEEGGPIPPQHQTNASVPGCEDDLGQVPETQPGTHHSKSHQLKEIARLKTQRAQAQQGVPYIDSQSHVNQQFPHQHAAQYSIGSTGQQAPSLQHPYTAGKYPGGIPLISNDQQQILPEPNHPVASLAGGFPRQFDSLQYQRGPASQSQHQQQQQPFYGFSQTSAPSSKLSHIPSQVQQLYSQRFSSQPVIPTTQGARLVTPLTSPDLARYSISRSQPQYQRQTSMPPLQSQAFLNSDTQYQCQVADFQEYQPRFSTPVADPSNHYDYLQRNSFPFYHRNNTQTERNLSHGMQQNLGSSQASLLRGVLPNASQNMNPPDRDSFLMNPNLNMSLSSTIQSSSVLTGRSPTTNGDLNPGIPRSQHSSVMYRNNAPVKSTSLLQQGGKFQGTSNARKGTLDGNMSVLTPTSVALGDMNERQSSLASCYAQFSGYSPLNALDKAPSFTSLLEQFAINQGNLETTYTESNQNYANLDLLGAILGQ